MNSQTHSQDPAQTQEQVTRQQPSQVAQNKPQGFRANELDTIRSAFPALHQVVNDEPFIYFCLLYTSPSPRD